MAGARKLVSVAATIFVAFFMLNAVIQAFSGEWTIVFGSVLLAGLALAVRRSAARQ